MKNFIVSLIILVCLIISIACNNQNQEETITITEELTSADSLEIIKGVIDATSNFEQYYNTRDIEHQKQYWAYNDPDFYTAVNEFEYPKGKAFEQMLGEYWKQPFDTTSIMWIKKNVIPLSKQYAHLHGEYHTYVSYIEGDTLNFTVHYSALFKKFDSSWKALRIHESYETDFTE